MNKVKIYGASTLTRYTEAILEQGFLACLWSTVDDGQDFTVYQIHGAPTALEEDRKIISKLKRGLDDPSGPKIVVLLHRPDEIQDRLPELKRVFDNAKRRFGLVFFGEWHLSDDFYCSSNAVKTIIPHGFFTFKPIFKTKPIVIGTNTTWGEMRSVKQAIELIDKVFELKGQTDIIGYLGGKPKEELDIKKLQEYTQSQLVDFEEFNPKSNYTGKRIIFVDHSKQLPDDLSPTFNTQLYYYGSKIRTGESSGSAHASLSIPVIFEINNAEKVEDVNVVKVPYGSLSNINSVDLNNGAQQIIDLIHSRKYVDMLKHNLEQSKKFNNMEIAKQYIELFNLLG